jgi:flagellar biosynthetic protein FliR
MIDEFLKIISGLTEQFDQGWLLFAGVFLRMGAVAFLAPGIGELSVPPRVRLAAAMALTMIVAPAIPPAAIDESAAALGALLVNETIAGLLIGFTLRIAIFIFQIFGAIVAQSLSITQLFGPGLGHDQESPLATIFISAGLALACAAGLHVKIALALIDTYEIIPLGGVANPGEIADFIVRQSATALSITFGLAAPFVLLGMAYSAALAASNRAMPQMAAVFVGAPAIALAGLMLVAGASWAVLSRWSEISSALFIAPLSGLP